MLPRTTALLLSALSKCETGMLEELSTKQMLWLTCTLTALPLEGTQQAKVLARSVLPKA